MDLVVFLLILCAVVLAVVGVVYLIWRLFARPVFTHLADKGIVQLLPPKAPTDNGESVPGRWKYFAGSGVVSVLLAIAADSIANMNTPGWWLMRRLSQTANEKGEPYDFATIVIVPFILDACLIFFAVWMVCSIWLEKAHQHGHKVENHP